MSRIVLSLVAFVCVWNAPVIVAHDECCDEPSWVNGDVWLQRSSEVDKESTETLSKHYLDTSLEDIDAEEGIDAEESSTETALQEEETIVSGDKDFSEEEELITPSVQGDYEEFVRDSSLESDEPVSEENNKEIGFADPVVLNEPLDSMCFDCQSDLDEEI